MKISAIAIIGFTVLFLGCKTSEKNSDDFIPDNLTEKFYWSPAEISGRYYDKAAMYLPISLDTVSALHYCQFDLGSDWTVLYQSNLKSLTEYNYLKFDSLPDSNPERPCFMIKDVDLNIGKIHFGKRNVLGFYNYGEPIIRKDNAAVSENSVGTIGADIFQNKILVINFPNETISVIDTTSSALENYFSFENCQIENKRIMVPLIVNGKTRLFMYDTGSSLFPMLTSFENWKEITNHNINDTLRIENFGNPVIMIGSNTSKEIKIGVNTLTDFGVYYEKDNYFDDIFEQLNCDGIIGNAFFLNKTICIDFQNKRFGIAK
ncbi:MAG: hypothetical protein ACK500_04885 [Flavobacteriales bacterium]|jgi:hypothetical protein